MTEVNYHLIDVFTNIRFGGNPLAIFPDARAIKEDFLQKITQELNLSETVFLYPPDKNEHWSMRIFTPGKELQTAGHPTIGAAFYLSREIIQSNKKRQTISLNQKVGLINVDITYKNDNVPFINMHQPLPTFGATHEDKKALIANMLSISTTEIDNLPIQEVSCGNNTLLIPLKGIEVLEKIKFNMTHWEKLCQEINDILIYPFTTHGVIECGVQGRMFAPHLGIVEDPATGSANGPLAAYLSHYDLVKMPTISFQGYEMGRPSQIHLDVTKNGQSFTSINVGGHCVYVGKGAIYLD
ncbi:MAG: PhzF family phenazine biosynthesis protein [Cyclobacteriaceae bacterium]